MENIETTTPAPPWAGDILRQRDEAQQWANWFREAGYDVHFTFTGEPCPFDREWQVWTAGDDGKRLATIDIDGCGASWHGPDDLWKAVVGRRIDWM